MTRRPLSAKAISYIHSTLHKVLADAVNLAVETARPLIEAAGHELQVALPAGPVFLDADLTRLSQVFSNLASIYSRGVSPSPTVPLILSMYVGKYLFRFRLAILLGACSGARTTTASLGMICDLARSEIPGLGYTVTYAVGNTLLTVWGMVLVMLLT